MEKWEENVIRKAWAVIRTKWENQNRFGFEEMAYKLYFENLLVVKNWSKLSANHPYSKIERDNVQFERNFDAVSAQEKQIFLEA